MLSIKYVTTPKFDNFGTIIFTARLAQADLVAKADFDTKFQDVSKKITSNKTKHLLVENELKNYKSWIQAILEVKINLKKMSHKTI